MSKRLQRALDAVANADTIALSGITFPFEIFGRYNPATGEDQICCVLRNERNYFELELQAQRHGKSVHDHFYAEMLPHLKARGCNTPPIVFRDNRTARRH